MLASCNSMVDRLQRAEAIAGQAGLQKEVITTRPFKLTTFHRLDADHKGLLVIYIEGDGQAFLRKDRISTDPTPQSPVVLELAARDPHASVLYIARPCQYLTEDELRSCHMQFWTTHRYSEKVVEAINEVISRIATGHRQIGLVGYSGGGAVATLIAARRKDVAWLITVAANLDHKVWTGLHRISPLSGSLNPADYAGSLRELPQLHLAGDKDRIVPSKVIQSYLDRMGDTRSVELRIMEGYNHDCCWVEVWPAPMNRFAD